MEKKTVFIIDDSKIYQSFMKSHFTQLGGYDVEAFTDADVAAEQLKTKKPDLVILDHNLDDNSHDGLYYLRQIKKQYPRLPVLYITGDQSEEVRKSALKLGAHSIILKSPAYLVLLRTAIDELSKPKPNFFKSLFPRKSASQTLFVKTVFN